MPWFHFNDLRVSTQSHSRIQYWLTHSAHTYKLMISGFPQKVLSPFVCVVLLCFTYIKWLINQVHLNNVNTHILWNVWVSLMTVWCRTNLESDKKSDWNSLLLNGCNFSPGQNMSIAASNGHFSNLQLNGKRMNNWRRTNDGQGLSNHIVLDCKKVNYYSSFTDMRGRCHYF